MWEERKDERGGKRKPTGHRDQRGGGAGVGREKGKETGKDKGGGGEKTGTREDIE